MLLIIFITTSCNLITEDISRINFCDEINFLHYNKQEIEIIEFEDSEWFGVPLYNNNNEMTLYIESYFKDFSKIFRIKIYGKNYFFHDYRIGMKYMNDIKVRENFIIDDEIDGHSVYFPDEKIWINFEEGNEQIIKYFTVNVDCRLKPNQNDI